MDAKTDFNEKINALREQVEKEFLSENADYNKLLYLSRELDRLVLLYYKKYYCTR